MHTKSDFHLSRALKCTHPHSQRPLSVDTVAACAPLDWETAVEVYISEDVHKRCTHAISIAYAVHSTVYTVVYTVLLSCAQPIKKTSIIKMC